MIETNNQLLTTEQVILDLEVENQKDALMQIAVIAKTLGFINKEKKLLKAFLAREKQASTGFGEEIAIPHARSKDILKPGVFFIRLKSGVEWNAIDGQPVLVLVALIVPEDKAADVHMDLITKISRKIIKTEIQELLKTETDKNKIITTLIS